MGVRRAEGFFMHRPVRKELSMQRNDAARSGEAVRAGEICRRKRTYKKAIPFLRKM